MKLINMNMLNKNLFAIAQPQSSSDKSRSPGTFSTYRAITVHVCLILIVFAKL